MQSGYPWNQSEERVMLPYRHPHNHRPRRNHRDKGAGGTCPSLFRVSGARSVVPPHISWLNIFTLLALLEWKAVKVRQQSAKCDKLGQILTYFSFSRTPSARGSVPVPVGYPHRSTRQISRKTSLTQSSIIRIIHCDGSLKCLFLCQNARLLFILRFSYIDNS